MEAQVTLTDFFDAPDDGFRLSFEAQEVLEYMRGARLKLYLAWSHVLRLHIDQDGSIYFIDIEFPPGMILKSVYNAHNLSGHWSDFIDDINIYRTYFEKNILSVRVVIYGRKKDDELSFWFSESAQKNQ